MDDAAVVIGVEDYFQWEYAARSAGKNQPYPWGSDPPTCTRAVMDDGGAGCARNATWPACTHWAGNTTQGLCDMLGNAWEWTADWYGPFGPDDATDPAGPALGTRRVYRGASWASPAGRGRAANRDGGDPADCVDYLGFRVVR